MAIRLTTSRPASSELLSLSLHDALPISAGLGIVGSILLSRRGQGQELSYKYRLLRVIAAAVGYGDSARLNPRVRKARRSEEHTSELQSLAYLVCRLLLEKKKLRIDHTTL